MKSNEYDILWCRIRILESDNRELRRIIDNYRVLEKNLRSLLREKNKEIEKLKNNSKQLSFNFSK